MITYEKFKAAYLQTLRDFFVGGNGGSCGGSCAVRGGCLCFAASRGDLRQLGGVFPDVGVLYRRVCFGQTEAKARDKAGISLRSRFIFALSYREFDFWRIDGRGIFRKASALCIVGCDWRGGWGK